MYIVEFIPYPLNTGWSSVETVGSFRTSNKLIEFFERELECVDGFIRDEVEDILEAEQWPICTAHYRITCGANNGRHARYFADN